MCCSILIGVKQMWNKQIIMWGLSSKFLKNKQRKSCICCSVYRFNVFKKFHYEVCGVWKIFWETHITVFPLIFSSLLSLHLFALYFLVFHLTFIFFVFARNFTFLVSNERKTSGFPLSVLLCLLLNFAGI